MSPFNLYLRRNVCRFINFNFLNFGTNFSVKTSLNGGFQVLVQTSV